MSKWHTGFSGGHNVKLDFQTLLGYYSFVNLSQTTILFTFNFDLSFSFSLTLFFFEVPTAVILPFIQKDNLRGESIVWK